MFGKKKKGDPEELEKLENEVTTEDTNEEAEEEEMSADEALADEPEKKKPKKKLPGWAIIPIIAAIIVLFFVAQAFAGGGSKEAVATFDVVKVEKGDVKETFATTGTVESEKTKVFYSPVNAKVATLNAKVGQVVKAGSVLVAFDTTNLERDNQQSQLQAQSTALSNQETVQQANKAQAKAAESASKAEQEAVNAYNDVVNQQNAVLAQMNNLYPSVQAEIARNNANSPLATAARAEIAKLNQTIQDYQTRIALIQTYTDMGEAAFNTSDAQKAEGGKTLTDLQAEADKLANDVVYYLPKAIADQEAIIAQHPDDTTNQDQYAALQGQYNSLEDAINAAAQGLNVESPDDLSISSAQLGTMQISEDLAALATLSTEELLAKGREGMKAEFDGVIADVKAIENTDAVQGGEMFTLADMKNVDVSIEIPTEDYEKVKVGQKGNITIGSHNYNGTVQTVNRSQP